MQLEWMAAQKDQIEDYIEEEAHESCGRQAKAADIEDNEKPFGNLVCFSILMTW